MPELSPKRDDGTLAIDTNVIVLYLIGDHPKQSAKARVLIDSEDVFVSTATFDRQFVKAAKAQGVRTVRALDV